jgi:hypothetical protein
MLMRLTRKDFTLFLAAATLIMLWSSIPNWAGYAAQNDQVAFAGTYFDPADYAVHIDMMRSGMNGAWGYNLRFTTEPHTTAYIRMFYIILGEINRPFGIDPNIVFQIARWLFGYTALFSIYLLTKRTFKDARAQWLAFFLAILGAGLGWLQIIFNWVPGKITPVDLWLIDAYVMFSISLFPHFAFTLTLMFLAFMLYLDFLDSGGWPRIVGIILAAILVQFVNPIAFAVVDMALASSTFAHWLKNKKINVREIQTLALIAIAQLPLLAYNFLLLSRDPIWSQFTAQNLTLSPPPIYYLWGFGLFWPFALIAAFHAIREKNIILLSSLAWIIAAFALAYAPFGIQRRFLLGVTIPFSLLAAKGIQVVLDYLAQKNPWFARRVPGLTLIFLLLTSVTTFILAPDFSFYLQSHPENYYYPRQLNATFSWISANTRPDDFILSTEHTGQLAAQFTGRRVFIGHEMETLNYAAKEVEVENFYQGKLPSDWINQYPIKWVIYGPYEQMIAPNFKPTSNLELVFQSDSVQIYEVTAR